MSDDNASANNEAAPKKKTWLWIVGGILGVGLVGSIISGPGDSDTVGDTSREETSTNEEIVEEEVEFEEPTSYASIGELEDAIIRQLGDETNTGLAREVTLTLDGENNWLNVTFVANENLTSNMTRRGIWRDIGTIFDLTRKWDQVEELTVTAKFPLISNLGEELGPQDVVTAYFDPEVYPRINADNLPGERLGDAASFVRIHPALQ